MEVIIHGKPLDASERCTAGIDTSLARNIIDEFFALGAIKEPEALVVDARYWQGAWTSVYTLLLSKSIKDRAERDSYFAISLVLPQRYCCMVSEVYYLLEKVVKENVIGVYLDQGLRYIVPNFEDQAAFERLCAKLQASYKNLEKVFDRSFQPQATLSTNLYYSINDCDSMAFVNQLKTKGRIIVTEKADTKDALAAQSTKFMREAQQAKEETTRKQTKIAELETQVSQLEEASRRASNSVSGKVKKLENQVAALQAEKEQISKKWEASQTSLNTLQDKVTQATQLLGVPELRARNHEYDSTSKKMQTDNNSYLSYLPAVNTLLILFIAVGLLMNLKGCSDKGGLTQKELEATKVQVESLADEIAQKDKEINRLRKDNETLEQTLEQYRTEMDNTMRQFQERARQLAIPSKTEKPQTQPKAEQKKEVKAEQKHDSSTETSNNKKDTKQ